MAETATAAPAASAETPARDWSALAVELGETPETTPAPATPSPTTEKPVTEKPAEGTPPTETPVPDEALTRLDEIIKGQEPAPAAPATEKPVVNLSPEAQTLQYWQTNPEFAQVAVTATTRYLALEQAASQGDVSGVLNQFAPQFQQALVEQLYQTHKQQFVERFIAEAEGRPQQVADPRVAKLEQELNQIRGTLTQRQQAEQQYAQQQSSQQLIDRFNQNWNALFDAVKITDPTDRDFLEGAVMRRIAKDPKAAKNVQEGRFGEINKTFRDVFVTWQKRQTGLVTATDQVRNQQEQKKAAQLTNTAAATEVASGEEPDVNEDGVRTQGFWKRNLEKIGLG